LPAHYCHLHKAPINPPVHGAFSNLNLADFVSGGR
jgi:hypothetical protein